MFGIIAGVLVTVWAMYTMLSEEADVKTAVAEIRVIREAAVQFRKNNGDGTYNNMTLATIGSYLGDGIAQVADDPPRGVILSNAFGHDVYLISDAHTGFYGGNLQLSYHGIPNLDVCRQILERFGEVKAITKGRKQKKRIVGYYTPEGTSIPGYVAVDTQRY